MINLKILIFIIWIKIMLLGMVATPAIVSPVKYVPEPEKTIITLELNSIEKVVNKVRADNGLNELQASQCLRDRAGLRLNEIKDNFSHYWPNGNYSVKEQYCNATKKGENLARDLQLNKGYENALIMAWLNSPTHKDVILNSKYNYIGIIESDGYVVMEVGD